MRLLLCIPKCKCSCSSACQINTNVSKDIFAHVISKIKTMFLSPQVYVF